jgi:hypothetical protein
MFLFLFPDARGQEMEGYCVKLNGDTVRGEFAGKFNRNINRSALLFISENSKKIIKITPEEYSYVDIPGIVNYISYSGTRLSNPYEFNSNVSEHEYTSEDHFDSVHAFLRHIGQVNVVNFFIYEDPSRNNIFYKTADSPPVELHYKKIMNSPGTMYDVAHYKEQLRNLFSVSVSSDVLEPALKNLTYTEASFRKFFNVISEGAKEKKHGIAGVGIVGGISYNFCMVDGIKNGNQISSQYDTSPFVALSYLFSGKGKYERYFLLGQVRVHTFQHVVTVISDAHKDNLIFSGGIVAGSLNIGYNVVNTKPVKVLLAPGASALFYNNNISYYGTDEGFDEGRKFALQANLSMDIYLINRFIFSVQYGLPAPIADQPGYHATHSFLQMGVGFRF